MSSKPTVAPSSQPVLSSLPETVVPATDESTADAFVNTQPRLSKRIESEKRDSVKAGALLEVIEIADISWQLDELGNTIPVSNLFGDVYYSVKDGLAEARYVFAENNYLPERFTKLFEESAATIVDNDSPSNQTFTIGELGFGTGLNVLVIWQLWQQVKRAAAISNNCTQKNEKENSTRKKPRLHIISTEQFPLSQTDLKRSLTSWQQRDSHLTPLIEQILTLYPPLIAGCHRLHLAHDITLDLWLGDAATSLAKIGNMGEINATVDAWLLDGFAPSRNQSLWDTSIFEQIYRLTKDKGTFATYSCAGMVKRGLSDVGFDIEKRSGFGGKRQMLIGQKNHPAKTASSSSQFTAQNPTLIAASKSPQNPVIMPLKNVAIIGSGVSGLMAAWSLAQRNIQVTLLDKTAPLAGASGNPRALMAPKMRPLPHVSEHLHSISYLYSQRLYRQLDAMGRDKTDCGSVFTDIFTPTTAIDLLLKANVNAEQIDRYPDDMALSISKQQSETMLGVDLSAVNVEKALYLPQSGLVNPKALADRILSHANIKFIKADIDQITKSSKQRSKVELQTTDKRILTSPSDKNDNPLLFDAVVIAAAYQSNAIDNRVFDFRKIRGQLSWFEPTIEQLEALPKLPLKYGGYCALFTPQKGDEKINALNPETPTFLLGASFVRNDLSPASRPSEDITNIEKLQDVIPTLQTVIHSNMVNDKSVHWQSRVGVRSQTPDYHPMVGALDETNQVWTISGMGAKGFSFAPICAEVLADMMTGQIAPLPSMMLAKLSPHRARLQVPLFK